MSDLLVFLIQLQSVFDAHAWLAQILIVVIFTAISLIAWFVFRKKNRNSRDYHKYLWRLFWQISSPVILWSIFILSSTQLLRIVANEFMPSLSGIIGDIRLFAVIWVMVRGIFKYLNSVEKVQIMHGKDSTTVSAITKLSKFSVLLLFSLIIADYFGVSFSGLLAFGGTGAIIIGLAGKDILSNFFSGLMIYIDRPFNVGDWVSSPDRNIEGTVQSIGWRLTKIFTFDNRPLYVPNSVFSNISVENPGRMTNRRITATIGLRYEDAEKWMML
ncbi:mechanosensitive ion channel family protein [Plesiomonas shigelloides subsp. oncorhynchi]|nr:mechanosensitive ion channel family protein [Plesiomonas shigelloides]